MLIACFCTLYATVATSNADIDIVIDGVRQGGTNGMARRQMDNAYYRYPLTVFYLATGLSAGSHSFTLQWKISSGVLYMEGASALGVGGQWIVREVS